MKTGRTVVVTGAAGGIGRPVVERFLANGDSVIAADKDEAALAALDGHPKLSRVQADVTREHDCAAVVEAAGGRIDVLVNIAGWYPIVPFDELTAEHFREVVDVNLTSAFLMLKAAWPLIKGRGWGRIVVVGSASTFEGVPDQIHYVAAKAGLFGLARSFAKIAGPEGVTVNVVTPGLTTTAPVRRTMSANILQKSADDRVLKRKEEAGDLVGPIFFLASPDAGFVSGQTVNVDGGKHML